MTMHDRRSILSFGVAVAGLSAAPALARPRGFFARHSLPIGIQLYTVASEMAKDPEGTLAQLAAVGFRTLELAGYFGHTPAALRAAADKAGIRFTSIHLQDVGRGKNIGLDADAGRIANDMRVLGIEDVVMPMLSFSRTGKPNAGETAEAFVGRIVAAEGAGIWKRTAALLNARGAALLREGLRLDYHNHSLEFAPVANTTGLDILMNETDPKLIGFEMDAGWVAAAGADPIAVLRRYPRRFRQMHVKNIKPSTEPTSAMGQNPTEIGSGVIQWARLLPAAYAAGIRQFYVEQEPPFVGTRMDAVAKSFAFLTNQV